jgi:hypothetical protein
MSSVRRVSSPALWGKGDERVGRVEPPLAYLRLGREVIGREGMRLDQHLVAFRGGPVEADHQQVKVDGEAVHRHDLVGAGTDESGELIADQRVVVLPGEFAGEVAFDTERCPTVELGGDVARSGLW